MRTGRPKKPLEIADEDHEKLRMLAHRPKSAQAMAMRARIVLSCGREMSDQAGHCVTAGYKPWQPPHHTHDFGQAVDFRANCGANSVIRAAYNDFKGYCQLYGLSRLAFLEDAGKANQHIHCDGNTVILQ